MLRHGTTIIPILSRKKLVILSANGEKRKTNLEVLRIAWKNSMPAIDKLEKLPGPSISENSTDNSQNNPRFYLAQWLD